MATEKQIAANRKNALMSTGPKSAAGRERASMNSYRDGMRSKKRKLLVEESYIAENRKHKWMAAADPCNDVAEFLMHQSVCASFEVEHAVRVNLHRADKIVDNSDDKEIEAARALGRRLFFDRCGPTGAYGNIPDIRTKDERKRKTSTSGKADDPDDPAKLVAELEKTAPGCIWMRDRWQELRDLLERDVFQSVDRLRAIRLLGRQPADIARDRAIAVIFIASVAVDPAGKTGLEDLLSDMHDTQVRRLRRRLWKRHPELFNVEKAAEFKQLLSELIDEQIERLQAMVEEFESKADGAAQASVADSKLDKTPEAYRLLNYIMRARKELRVGVAAFEKYNKGAKNESGRTPRSTGDEGGRTSHRGRPAGGGMPEEVDLSWAYDASAASDRGAEAGSSANGVSPRELARIDSMLDTVLCDGADLADDSIGSGGAGIETGEAENGGLDHQRDATASASSTHCGSDSAIEGDLIPATESVAGVTSEPNFDEDVVRTQNEVPVDVAADFGAFSGLDKGGKANSKSEVGTLEVHGEGEIRESKSESRDPERGIDRRKSQLLPGLLSKSERRRVRREMERREVERRVEKLLKAGGASAAKMIEKVLAASPRVRRVSVSGASNQGDRHPNTEASDHQIGKSSSRTRSP